MPPRVLLVDDNVVFARGLLRALAGRGLEGRWLTHGSQVASELDRGEFDVAVVEAVLPGLSGVRLVEQLRARSPRTRVIVVAASASLETAVEAMKKGAVDYVLKPVSPDVLAEAVRELAPAETAADEGLATTAAEIVGESAALRQVMALVARVATTDAAVLICGESGTGKELVAREIHRTSRRAGHLFLAVNCGALAAGVLESELFGHVRGAFTGARAARRGLFEEADRGTLFLDEIASTPLSFQVKLLRALEEGSIRPVGSSESRRTDVRVIAAANVDLQEAVRAGRFRDDLYYRLNVVSIGLPPLRERGGDLEALARHFVARTAAELGKPAPAPTAAFLELLARHRWPGNVRELRNAIERSVLLADGGRLEPEHLPADLLVSLDVDARAEAAAVGGYAEAKRVVLERFTRDYLERLLRQTGGNVSRAARIAGVPRQTLHRLLRAVRGVVP